MNTMMAHLAACLLLGAGLLSSGCTSRGRGSMWARPMTTNELSDTWAGFTGDGIYYLLELHSDGTGVGGYVHSNGEARTFGIPIWRYADYRISFSIEERKQKGDQIKSITGSVGWNHMTLKVAGSNWTRDVTLRRESDRQRKDDLVRNSLREYGTRKPKLNKCLDNLLRIDIAIMNWAIEEEKTTNDVPTWDDLRRNLEEDERLEKLNGVPFCPTGGTYKLGGVGEGTKCSKHRQ